MITNRFVQVDGSPIRYDVFVAALFKSAGETFRNMVDHARGGVNEEAGEISNCLKRHVVYGKDLNRENLIEELGDIEFYLQAIKNLYVVSDQEILQANADKLSERYKGLKYSDAAAQARADKKEGE